MANRSGNGIHKILMDDGTIATRFSPPMQYEPGWYEGISETETVTAKVIQISEYSDGDKIWGMRITSERNCGREVNLFSEDEPIYEPTIGQDIEFEVGKRIFQREVTVPFNVRPAGKLN